MKDHEELAARWNTELVGTPATRLKSSQIARCVDLELGIGPYRHPQGPIPLRPVLLPSTSEQQLTMLTRQLLRLVRQIGARFASDPYELAAQTRYRPPPVPMLTADPAWNASTFDMARPDLVFSGGVARFVECNVTSAMAGPEQLTRLNRVFSDTFPLDKSLLDSGRLVVPDSLSGRRNVVLRAAKQRGVDDPRICLLGWKREGFGSAEYFSDVIDDFTKSGLCCDFAIPNDLESSSEALTYDGSRIDIALRMFLASDADEDNVDMSPLRHAMHEGTALTLSPELAEVYSSKIILAWLSESAGSLEAADRDFVHRHVPWTRVLRDGPTIWLGRRVDLLALLQEQRRLFLIKPFDKHGGDGALVGRDVSDRTWRAGLEHALDEGHFVVQEFLAPDPIVVPVYQSVSGEVVVAQAASVFSPILMGGELNGVLVRHTDVSTTSVVNAVGGGVMNTAWFFNDD